MGYWRAGPGFGGPRFEQIDCLLSRGNLFTIGRFSNSKLLFNNLYPAGSNGRALEQAKERCACAWLSNLDRCHENTANCYHSRLNPGPNPLARGLPVLIRSYSSSECHRKQPGIFCQVESLLASVPRILFRRSYVFHPCAT